MAACGSAGEACAFGGLGDVQALPVVAKTLQYLQAFGQARNEVIVANDFLCVLVQYLGVSHRSSPE